MSRIEPTGLFNIIAGSGGNAALIGSGGEASSGGYYNIETGSGGGFLGFVTGSASNVAGAFEN